MEDELDVSTESSEIFPGKLPRDSFSEDSKAINESLKDDAEVKINLNEDKPAPNDSYNLKILQKRYILKRRISSRLKSQDKEPQHDSNNDHDIHETESKSPNLSNIARTQSDTDERDYVHDVDVPSDGPRKGWLGKLGKGKSRVAVRRVRKISTEDAAVHDAAPSHPVREREPLPPVMMSHHSSQLQHHEKAQEHLLKKPQPQDNPRLHRRPVHGSVSTGSGSGTGSGTGAGAGSGSHPKCREQASPYRADGDGDGDGGGAGSGVDAQSLSDNGKATKTNKERRKKPLFLKLQEEYEQRVIYDERQKMDKLRQEIQRKKQANPSLKDAIEAHKAQYLDNVHNRESRMKQDVENRKKDWKLMEDELRKKREHPARINPIPVSVSAVHVSVVKGKAPSHNEEDRKEGSRAAGGHGAEPGRNIHPHAHAHAHQSVKLHGDKDKDKDRDRAGHGSVPGVNDTDKEKEKEKVSTTTAHTSSSSQHHHRGHPVGLGGIIERKTSASSVCSSVTSASASSDSNVSPDKDKDKDKDKDTDDGYKESETEMESEMDLCRSGGQGKGEEGGEGSQKYSANAKGNAKVTPLRLPDTDSSGGKAQTPPLFTDPHTPVEAKTKTMTNSSRGGLLASASAADADFDDEESDNFDEHRIPSKIPSQQLLPAKPKALARHRQIKKRQVPSLSSTGSSSSPSEDSGQHPPEKIPSTRAMMTATAVDDGSHVTETTSLSEMSARSDRTFRDPSNWVSEMLELDSDEEKLAELYEAGFSLLMTED